jgi:hypothetical protein
VKQSTTGSERNTWNCTGENKSSESEIWKNGAGE